MRNSFLVILIVYSFVRSDFALAESFTLDFSIWLGEKREEVPEKVDPSITLTVSRSQPLKVGVGIFFLDVEQRLMPIEYRVVLGSGCGDEIPWLLTEKVFELSTSRNYGSVKFLDCDELSVGETELIGTVYAADRSDILREIRIPVEVLP